MGNRVDLNEFTKAVNTYSSIVGALANQVEVLEKAGTTARSAMAGEEEAIQSLYMAISDSKTKVKYQIDQLKGIVKRIEAENEYYIKILGVLE